jgi:hypothetical protein
MVEKSDNEISEKALKLARETMTGDLRDCLLDFMKHDKEVLPWNMLSEEKQRDKIEKVTRAVTMATEKAVGIIAADGKTTIKATLEKITIKDGIKAEFSLSQFDTQRHALIDAQGSVIHLVVADKEAYEGERKAAKPDPNQRNLIQDDDDQKEAA